VQVAQRKEKSFYGELFKFYVRIYNMATKKETKTEGYNSNKSNGPYHEILLILVGILLLLQNMGRLPTWIGRYWPILIILWGIYALVSKCCYCKE